jgi:CMP-2-keto-3-deoxyoctulosonic acid synthetase
VIDIEQSYERARIVNVNAPDPSMRTEEIQEVLEKIEAFKKRVSPVFEIESELKKAAGRRVA